jgi:hypothetical protein
MKPGKTFLIFLLVLTSIAGGWLGWREYLETIELRARLPDPTEQAGRQTHLDQLTATNKELQDQIAALQSQIGLLQDQLNAHAPSVPSAGGTDARAPMSGPAASQAGIVPDTSLVARATLASNPNSPLLAAQALTVVGAHYDALLKQLGLGPDQADQLKNLIALRMQTVAGAVTPLLPSDGSDPAAAMPAIRQAAVNAQMAVDAQIQAQFGAAVATQYEQYQQTFPQRNTIDQLAMVLGNGPAPLSEAQYSQMVQLLAQTQLPDDGGGPQRIIFGSVNYHSRISDQTIAAASSVLSPAQVQVLQQIQKQQ